MDDPPPVEHESAAAPPGPRRKGLIVPLPAVVVGLGLASGPAVAQSFHARPDTYTIPADAAAFLPVLANDTSPNAFPLVFLSRLPSPGGKAVPQAGGFQFAPPPGFTGTVDFAYCIQGGSPPSACANVFVIVQGPDVSVPALSGAALAGLSGVLGWLGLRLRRRA
jgi:hypothetical protein